MLRPFIIAAAIIVAAALIIVLLRVVANRRKRLEAANKAREIQARKSAAQQALQEQFLEALRGTARLLHKSAPEKVIWKAGFSANDAIQHNLQLLTGGRVSIASQVIYVPAGTATAVLAHFGALGTNISEVTVSGSRTVQKAPWIDELKNPLI